MVALDIQVVNVTVLVVEGRATDINYLDCAKYLTLSCKTALFENWKDMYLMGGTLTG